MRNVFNTYILVIHILSTNCGYIYVKWIFHFFLEKNFFLQNIIFPHKIWLNYLTYQIYLYKIEVLFSEKSICKGGASQ